MLEASGSLIYGCSQEAPQVYSLQTESTKPQVTHSCPLSDNFGSSNGALPHVDWYSGSFTWSHVRLSESLQSRGSVQLSRYFEGVAGEEAEDGEGAEVETHEGVRLKVSTPAGTPGRASAQTTAWLLAICS